MRRLIRIKTGTAMRASVVAFGVALSPAALPVSVIDQVEQGVVRVINAGQKTEGFYFNGVGSGVVIDGAGSILTNAHVLIGNDKIFVQWKTTAGEVRDEEAQVIKQDRKRDLALIRVSGIEAPPVAIAVDLPAKGTTVYAIGFPGVADTGGTAEDINSRFFEATVTQGVVGRVLSREMPGGLTWSMVQHSAVISGGSSGGALVNSCGHLIGINSNGALVETKKGDLVEAGGFSFAIQAPEAFKFAVDNGANPSRVQSPCNPISEPATGNTEDAANEPPLSPSVLALFFGATAIFGAAIAVVGRAREKRPAQAVPSASENRMQWDIEGITTMNERIRIVVTEDRHTDVQPLIVGRDTGSGAVVRDPTVSRTHAKLFVARGELWCADLGSSNGTKINDKFCGQLPTPVPRKGVLTFGKVALQVRTSASRSIK